MARKKIVPKKPRKKTSKRVTPLKKHVVVSANPFSQIEWSESYASLLLGLAVVLLAAVIGVTVLRGKRTHLRMETSSTSTSVFEEQKPIQLPGKYIVVNGDDLSNISQKFYRTQDNWEDIAKANNLADPNNIPAGTQLIIPKVSGIPLSPTSNITPTQQPGGASGSNAISGKTYTTQDGDFIWDIALRAYGDGYRAPDIIKANNLSNPDQLTSGMVLKIPRP